jgi:hypothetical protein
LYFDFFKRFICNCTGTGFTGEFCKENIDDCANVVCEHDGTCVDGINSFKCNCHPGYTGSLCDIDIDECASSPCFSYQNDHQLKSKCWQNSDKDSFLRRLELLSQKLTTTSQNLNDTQIETTTKHQLPTPQSSINITQFDLSFDYRFNYAKAEGYWCECAPGLTGDHCQTEIDECESSPCIGNQGTCIDLPNGYKCDCLPGFTGVNCEFNINECETTRPCAAYTKCTDLIPDYSKQSDTTGSDIVPIDGYSCDCSPLNDILYRQTGNRHISYAGKNCTMKLNACESLSHLCQFKSTCRSVLSLNNFNNNIDDSKQDIICQCQPGYTGKYCQYSTTIHFDGTYSLHYTLPPIKINSRIDSAGRFNDRKNLFNFSLQFRLPSIEMREKRLPLVYIEEKPFITSSSNDSKLIIEIHAHRDHLHIINGPFNIDEKMPYLRDVVKWHSLQISFENEMASQLNSIYKYTNIKIVYSAQLVKSKPNSEQKSDLVKVDKLIRLYESSGKGNERLQLFQLMPNSFKIGEYFQLNRNTLNAAYLYGACVRDIKLNDAILFANDAISSIDNSNIDKSLIKYGCQQQMDSFEGCNDNICKNGAECLPIEQFNSFQCVGCQRPFYGRRCEYLASMVAFIFPNRFSSNVNKKRPSLKLTRTFINSNSDLLMVQHSSFKIKFNFRRVYPINGGKIQSDFAFLALKESSLTQTSSNNLYVLGINTDGYFYLKKYHLYGSQLSPTIWTVQNQEINFNQNVGQFQVELKLNQKFIELIVNEEFVSRFELTNNGVQKQQKTPFHIEQIEFKSFSPISDQNSFIISELKINDFYYDFNSMLTNKWIIFNSNKFNEQVDLNSFREASISPLYQVNDYTDLNLFNSTNDNLQLLTKLNRLDGYCPPNYSTIIGSSNIYK